MSLLLSVHAGRQGLDALLGAWTELAGRAEHVPAPPGLLRHVVPSLHPEAPLLLVAHEAGELVAVWPLARIRRGPLRLLIPLGRELQSYTGPTLLRRDPALLAALAEGLAELDADLLHLPCVSDLVRDHLPASATWRPGAAPTVQLSEHADLAAFLASRSKNRRKGLRRNRRQLERLGLVRFEGLEGADDRREATTTALAWKRAWLAEQGLVSLPLSQAWFERSLISAAQDPELLADFGVLRLSVGGRAAALELGFRAGDTFHSYLGAFDPSLATYGPGAQLTLATIGWLLERGVPRYDLLSPVTEFKASFCSDRLRHGEVIWPLSRRGQAARSVFEHRKRWARAALAAAPAAVREGAVKLARIA